MTDIICIHTAYNAMEADLIRARLESAGIACFLRTDNGGGTLPYLNSISGIGVMVRAEDGQAATDILGAADDVADDDAGDDAAGEDECGAFEEDGREA